MEEPKKNLPRAIPISIAIIAIIYIGIVGVAIIFTLLLLIKFDWVGQFTIKDADGNSTTNIFAILSMLIGYVFVPFILMAWKKFSQRN